MLKIMIMFSSTLREREETNSAMRLATGEGRKGLSCPLGIALSISQENVVLCQLYYKQFFDQACLVKMARYWPRSFIACLWISAASRSVNRKKKDRGQF